MPETEGEENDKSLDEEGWEGQSLAVPREDQREGASEADELRDKLNRIEMDFRSLQGRLAPTQQELESYRSEARTLRLQLEQQERARQQEIEELRSQLSTSETSLDDLLTAEERELIDPDVLQAFVKVADRVAARRQKSVDVRAETLKALQERDERRVREYREQLLIDPTRGLHNLDVLSRDPRFVEWAQSDDVDLDSTLNSLLNARTEKDVDRYARAASRKIAQFNTQSKRQERQPADQHTADPQVRLHAGMRRSNAPRISDADRDKLLVQAKALARSGNYADRAKANDILSKLN
jgi:hypothetical protein